MKDLDFENVALDEKSYEDIFIYHFGYIVP